MADTKILGVFTTVREKQLTALTHMLSFSHLQDTLLFLGPWRRMQEKHSPEHSPAFLWIGKRSYWLARWQNLLVRKRRSSCCMEGVEWEVRQAGGQPRVACTGSGRASSREEEWEPLGRQNENRCRRQDCTQTDSKVKPKKGQLP